MSDARCRVCGVHSVKRAGQVIIYCLDGCPMSWDDISNILDRADQAYAGGAEELIRFWASSWERLDKRVRG